MTESNHCVCLLGGQFKVFVEVSSDEVFVAFLGVILGLLLLTIALLGHLLGFHIYLSKEAINN